jgi:UDP-3-O-acyl N-acetylglucosamine deacetylase
LNYSLRKQRTIGRSVRVSGFGYWSGRDVSVEFCPAPAGTGVVFVRTDLPSPVRIAANVANRIETPRRTTLAEGGATVEMVEHILAALAGVQVDNCEVRVDRPEMPGCDGSSFPFVEALQQAGIVEQPATRTTLVVTEVTRVGNEDAWVEARPHPKPGLSVAYRLDYGKDNPIGRQSIQVDVSAESFSRELAPARTFILQSEADWLRNLGLGARVTCHDLLVFDEHGPVDNPLRYEDECVRHKALDLVGDLSLAGCDLVGQFTAYRSGHRLNADLVRVLLTEGLRIEGQPIQGRKKSA